MEATEKPINEKESLAIISRMIESAKSEIQESGFLYMLWGYLVLVACAANYIMQFVMDLENPWLPWAILMPIGGIISSIHGSKRGKRQRVRTIVDEYMIVTLISFLAPLLITLLMMFKLELNTYPMIMLFYGVWLFNSGGILRAKALIIGGIINWICACIAFFQPFEIQLMILAAAVLLGYVIPGHILYNQFRNQTHVQGA